MIRAGFIVVLGTLCCGRSLNAQLPAMYSYAVNNYGGIEAGMPNYGIAQGSIFTVFYSAIPTITTTSQSVPLAPTLAGVSVMVTVGQIATRALPYYVSPGQLDAILPSATPVGSALITVTSGGESREAFATVVPSAFGLATVPPGGTVSFPVALAQNNNEGGQLLDQFNAANPGEYLTFWGAGLGPVPGDETQYQTPRDLTEIPIEVDIGGVSATVAYHGRSTYPGLDQIDVIVPQGVSGCNVSVVITAGGVPANVAMIPVAPSGRTCSDPGLVPITVTEYLTNFLGRDSVNIGVLSLATFRQLPLNSQAYATFQGYTARQFTSGGFLQQPSLGSCLVGSTGYLPAPVPLLGLYSPLEAGPQVNVGGPEPPVGLLPAGVGSSYYVDYGGPPYDGSSPDTIVPPSGGTFTFDNGSGGRDVGAFSVSLTQNIASPLIWKNRTAIAAIDRTKGQSITWTGGTPGDYVYIFGYSAVYGASPAAGPTPYYVSFVCTAPLSAGQFTIPAAVLESMPPTGTVPFPWLSPAQTGYLYVAGASIQGFSAPGLYLGLLFFAAGSGISVPYN